MPSSAYDPPVMILSEASHVLSPVFQHPTHKHGAAPHFSSVTAGTWLTREFSSALSSSMSKSGLPPLTAACAVTPMRASHQVVLTAMDSPKTYSQRSGWGHFLRTAGISLCAKPAHDLVDPLRSVVWAPTPRSPFHPTTPVAAGGPRCSSHTGLGPAPQTQSPGPGDHLLSPVLPALGL